MQCCRDQCGCLRIIKWVIFHISSSLLFFNSSISTVFHIYFSYHPFVCHFQCNVPRWIWISQFLLPRRHWYPHQRIRSITTLVRSLTLRRYICNVLRAQCNLFLDRGKSRDPTWWIQLLLANLFRRWPYHCWARGKLVVTVKAQAWSTPLPLEEPLRILQQIWNVVFVSLTGALRYQFVFNGVYHNCPVLSTSSAQTYTVQTIDHNLCSTLLKSW